MWVTLKIGLRLIAVILVVFGYWWWQYIMCKYVLETYYDNTICYTKYLDPGDCYENQEDRLEASKRSPFIPIIGFYNAEDPMRFKVSSPPPVLSICGQAIGFAAYPVFMTLTAILVYSDVKKKKNPRFPSRLWTSIFCGIILYMFYFMPMLTSFIEGNWDQNLSRDWLGEKQSYWQFATWIDRLLFPAVSEVMKYSTTYTFIIIAFLVSLSIFILISCIPYVNRLRTGRNEISKSR